jgi:hypothetical protein
VPEIVLLGSADYCKSVIPIIDPDLVKYEITAIEGRYIQYNHLNHYSIEGNHI